MHEWYAERTEGLNVALQWAGYCALRLAQTPSWTTDLDDRVVYFMDMVDAFEAMADRKSAFALALRPAKALEDAQEFKKAGDLIADALERFPDIETYRDLHLVKLAEMRRNTGDYAEALFALDELEAMDPASLSDGVEASMLMIRGITYVNLGLADSAPVFVREGLSLVEQRYRDGKCSAGELLRMRGIGLLLQKANAAKDLADAIEGYLTDPLYGDHPGERRWLEAMLGRTQLLLARDEPELGPPAVELLRSIVGAGLEWRVQVSVHVSLAEHAIDNGEFDVARDELDATYDILVGKESAGFTQAVADVAVLETRMTLDQGRPREELLAREAALDEVFDEMIRVWDELPEREGGTAFLHFRHRRNAVAEKVRLTLALDPENGAETAFAFLLRLQALGTLAKRENVPVPTLDEVRSTLLAEGHGLLLYLPAHPHSLVFAVDEDDVTCEKLGTWAKLDGARYEYSAQLIAASRSASDPSGILARQERGLARKLAGLLFPDALQTRIATWTGLTIVGRDVLGVVPFEWLPVGDDPFLGVRYPLTYLPSVPLGVARAKRKVPFAQWDLMLMASTRPAESVIARWPEVVELPFAGPDEVSLLEPYARAISLTGDDATATALEASNPATATVFQFLGHAVRDLSRERPVALVAAPAEDDGLVWCEDVDRLTAPPLVILTACRSGLGKLRRGDPGMTDMGGAWISRGARAVVVSSTDLEYNFALAASEGLHERLAAGDSPAEALRRMRERMVLDDPEGAPLRGGLLQVVGLGHEPVFTAPPKTKEGDAPKSRLPLAWMALSGVVGFLIGGLFAARTRRARPTTA